MLTRSGSLGPNFERFAEKHNRRIEVNKDKSLATDDLLSRNEKLLGEVTGPLLSALGQMLDRRDMHQRRSFTDSMYTSDMGIAYRLQEQVKSVTELAKQLPQPQTPSSALGEEEKVQQQIQEKVLNVSIQLARSGRHEERLGNAQGAMDLATHSRSVEQVARGTLDQTRQELNRVVGESKRMERKQSDATMAEEVRAPFARPETNSAQDKLISAVQELATQAKQIEE